MPLFDEILNGKVIEFKLCQIEHKVMNSCLHKTHQSSLDDCRSTLMTHVLQFFILRLWLRSMAEGRSFSGANIRLRPKMKIAPTVQHCYLVKSDPGWPTYLHKNLTSNVNAPLSWQSKTLNFYMGSKFKLGTRRQNREVRFFKILTIFIWINYFLEDWHRKNKFRQPW